MFRVRQAWRRAELRGVRRQGEVRREPYGRLFRMLAHVERKRLGAERNRIPRADLPLPREEVSEGALPLRGCRRGRYGRDAPASTSPPSTTRAASNRPLRRNAWGNARPGRCSALIRFSWLAFLLELLACIIHRLAEQDKLTTAACCVNAPPSSVAATAKVAQQLYCVSGSCAKIPVTTRWSAMKGEENRHIAVYEELGSDILGGRFASVRFPSERLLALRLKASQSTITRCIAWLEREGLAFGRARRLRHREPPEGDRPRRERSSTPTTTRGLPRP